MLLQVAFEATSDCEAIGRGLLEQPANAVSSFAYVVVGLALVVRCWNRVPSPFLARERLAPGLLGAENDGHHRKRGLLALYGALVALSGLGSVAYHGLGGDGGRWFHDFGFLWAVGFIAAYDWPPAGQWDRRRSRVAVGAAGLIALAVIVPPLTNVVLVVVAAAASIAEVRAWPRRGLQERRILSWSAWVLVAAGAVFVTSRTGGTMCDPDSLLQGHALWHVLTAGIFGLWGLATFDRDGDQPTGEEHESQTELRPWSLRRRLLGLAMSVIIVVTGAWLSTQPYVIREGATYRATMTWIPNPCRNIDGNPVLGEVVVGDRRYWQRADQVAAESWLGRPVEGVIYILEEHRQPAAIFEADGTVIQMIGGAGAGVLTCATDD